MIFKVKKYISKPHIAIPIIIDRLKCYHRLINIKLVSCLKGVDIKLGKNIRFLQKTIISGEGKVIIGNDCSFGFNRGGYYYSGACEFQPRYKRACIIFGNNVSVNNNLFICCAKEIKIGDNTLIGEGVMFIDFDAHGIHPETRNTSIGNVRPIYIGKNVWIGSRVIILPGTQIGNNSIIGAGSVVKGEFPRNVIIAGNPAEVIRKL